MDCQDLNPNLLLYDFPGFKDTRGGNYYSRSFLIGPPCYYEVDDIKDEVSDVEYIKFENDLTRLNQLLENKDFETIAQDSELFWLLYCKTAHLTSKNSTNQISIEGSLLTLKCPKPSFTERKSCLEFVRNILVDSIQKEENTKIIMAFSLGCKTVLWQDRENYLLSKQDFASFIEDDIELSFRQIFESLGAKCSIIKETRLVDTELMDVKIIEVQWNYLSTKRDLAKVYPETQALFEMIKV